MMRVEWETNCDFFPCKLQRVEMCLQQEIRLNSRKKKRGISEFCQPCLAQKTFSLINPPFHWIDNCLPVQTFASPSLPIYTWLFLHQLHFNRLHCSSAASQTQICDGKWLLSSSITNWDIPNCTTGVSLTSLKKIRLLGKSREAKGFWEAADVAVQMFCWMCWRLFLDTSPGV